MVAFVAAALCADRSVASAPNLRMLESPMVREMAGRLILSIRKTIPDASMTARANSRPSTICDSGVLKAPAGFKVHVPIVAMRYRLPPPPLFG